MATVSPQQMQAPPLDKDYDYYGNGVARGGTSQNRPASTPSNTVRVKKGLGAMPMHHDDAPTHTYSSSSPLASASRITPVRPQQQGMDPPADSESPMQARYQNESTDGEEALLDLEQLEELHHEAERMKALGNKHMAAQVRKRNPIM
jgi:hypothetical protein